jgi:hypothetical protein
VAKLSASSHCSIDLRGPERVCELEVLYDCQCHEHDLFPSDLHCRRCDCATFAERARNRSGEALEIFAVRSENNQLTGDAGGLSRLALTKAARPSK